MYNIQIPGMDTIQIPAWATEETLYEVASSGQNLEKIQKDFVEITKGNSAKVKQIVNEVKNNAKQSKATNQDQISSQKSLSKSIKSQAQRILKTGQMMDPSTPITSFVELTKKFGPGLAKIAGPFMDRLAKGLEAIGGKNGEAGPLGSFVQAMKDGKGVISDAVFMLAGWNAGKLESFAAVQQQMIDNGAILVGTIDNFNDLRVQVNESGVTYDAFSKTIAANNAAVNAFGKTTSGGAKAFANLFESLDDASDHFGDFGLSNDELLKQSGEFLEYQRRTGRLQKDVANLEQNLVNSFTQLQIETAGLASITGFTRSQVLQAQLDSTPAFDAGAQFLEGKQLEAAEAAKETLNLAEEAAGPGSPISLLKEALFNTLANVRGDLGSVSEQMEGYVTAAGTGGEYGAIIKILGNDIFQEIEDALIEGPDAVDNLLYERLTADTETFGTAAGAATDELGSAMLKLQLGIREFKLKVGDITGDSKRDAVEKAKLALAESGTTIQLMNDATKAFLKIQEAVTFNMETLTKVFGIASDVLLGVAQTINPTFDPVSLDPSNETDTPTPTPSAEQNRFGGRVNANMPLIVGDEYGLDSAELFIPEVNGRIMSNREVQDMFKSDLTKGKNSNTIIKALEAEYRMIIETKENALKTLQNLDKYAQSKMLNDRLNDAIDASSA